MLDQSADVFKADAEGTLPLHMAAAACSIALVLRILNKMHELKKRDNHVIKPDLNGLQALHYAAGESHLEMSHVAYRNESCRTYE